MTLSSTSSTSGASSAPPPSPTAQHGGIPRSMANGTIPGVGQTASAHAECTAPPSRLVNFADLINIVVVGDPTEQQLGELETHFRAVNSTQTGGDALRRLRQLTESSGRHPIMIFNQETSGRPVTLERLRTARPDERVDLAAPASVNGSAQRGEERAMDNWIRAVAVHLTQSQQGRLARPGARGLAAVLASSPLLSGTPAAQGTHSGAPQPTHTPAPQPPHAGTRLQTTDAHLNTFEQGISIPTPVVTGARASWHTSAVNGNTSGPAPSVREQLAGAFSRTQARGWPSSGSSIGLGFDSDRLGLRFEPRGANRRNALGAEGNGIARPFRDISWSKALRPWLGRDCQAVVDQWKAIEGQAQEEADIKGIAAFRQFLFRLSSSDVCRDPAQRAEVVNWLAEVALPESVVLRAETFEACIEGTASCNDNIQLTWNKLRILKIKIDAQEGRYEGRLAELHGIALSIFKMQEIEKVADAKVQELYAARKRGDPSMFSDGKPKIIDPLETHLAYQIGLREALKLPIGAFDMIFPMLSNVTKDDINKARSAIEQAEKERFPVWLLADFDPFVAEIRRQLGPEISAEIVEAALEANEATFEQRLIAKLRAENLPDGDDQRREMGALLLREIQYETWLPHANPILIAAGLDALPSIDLDGTERAGNLVDSTLMA